MAAPPIDRVPLFGTMLPVLDIVAWRYSDEGEAPICWHFIHPLSQLIGGLFNAGFIIEKFVERPVADLNADPGSHARLAAYVPPFFAMMARRRNLG